MNLDQESAPLLEAIRGQIHAGTMTFGLPGHRHGRHLDGQTVSAVGRDPFLADISALEQARGHAEELAAAAFGADNTLIGTDGSTANVQVAILSVAGPGDVVLVDRNVHKSAISALILAGARPVYLRPQWDRDRQVAHPPTAEAVGRALRSNPDAVAVVAITPTEYGSGADIAGIADACHGRGVPLIVDEAWAAHFCFHPQLPTAALAAGADLVVHSIHKAGGALMQSSLLHHRGDLVDFSVVKSRYDLLSTTSSSNVLAGSVDGWRRLMATEGEQIIGAAIGRADRLRQRLSDCSRLDVFTAAEAAQHGVAEFDPLKICVIVDGLGITGYQARDWLQKEHNIQAQLGDARRVVFATTYADDDTTIDALGAALEALHADPPEPDRTAPAIPPLEAFNLEAHLSPREAFFADTEDVPAEKAPGRISAQLVSPYPPGVPAIAPGERINAEVVAYLRAGLAAGMKIPDAADDTLNTFRVVF